MHKDSWQAIFLKATEAHQQSRLPEAEQLYRQLLQFNPYHADTLHLLGIACSQQGKHEEAIVHISKAVRLQPDVPVFHNNLGEVFARKGETVKALSCFTKALQLAPGFADAHFNLANVLKQAGRLEEAVKHYKQTIQLKPTHSKALYNLANTLMEQGNTRSALEFYRQGVELQPDFAQAHNNLAIALQEWEEWEEATIHYRKAVSLNSAFHQALRNLASALETQGKYPEALACYQQMTNNTPVDAFTRFTVDILSPVIFSSVAHIHSHRQKLWQTLEQYQEEDFPLQLSKIHDTSLQPPSILIYQGENDRDIKEKYASLFSWNFKDAALPVKKTSPRLPHLGFVVTAGHEGVFLKCMRGMLNELSADKFRLTLVCSAPNGEKILRPAIGNPAVQYLILPRRFDLAAELMRQARFDVLYYWEAGTDVTNYFLPYCRIAPVQCTSWGWPVTSGIPTMDYFISSILLEPADGASHYSEKLVLLNRLPVYYYFPPVPALSKTPGSFGMPENRHLYLCTQNLRKVHPDFDRIVGQILDKDAMGVVVFIADKHASVTQLRQNRLHQAFPQLTDRIYFLPRLQEEAYLQLVSLADVVLDTLYYGGGANTCYDAFAAGTPIVTMPGSFHRGRYAFAAYQQMGIPDCIASDINDYIEKAVQMAASPGFRQKISRKILAAHPAIFEDKQAVIELSAWFEKVVRQSHEKG